MNIGKRYLKANEENYGNINRNEFTLIDRKKTGNEVILDFLKQKDVAAWFRGTSHFHIQGADRLFNALRDDGEQKTTHRVRTCLHLIGLKPMITSKQIMFLMRISRGNDLVFLWFLMEMHYKTPKDDPKSYSINEQLICSAICHLDMVTTLRELDRILPRCHPSQINMQQTGQKRQDLKEAAIKRKNKTNQKEYVLPYFSKYPRFQQYGECLFLREPDFKVKFNFYKRYSNPNHTEPNESNRWYANYRFNSSKRIVHLIIKEVIKNIFSNSEEVSLRLMYTEVLCDYHKTLKIMATNLEHELRVKAKHDCLKCHFGWETNNDKKIKDQLDEAVRQQLCKFKKNSKPIRKNESLKAITSHEKIVNIIFGENGPCLCNFNTNKNTNRNPNTTDDGGKLKEVAPKITCKQKHIHCDFDEKEPDCTETRGNIQREMNFKPNCTNFFEPQKEKIEGKIVNNNYDSCNVNDDTEAPVDAVFNRPTMHKPFQFDYQKIFAPQHKDDEKTCIRKIFLAALDESSLNLPPETDQPHRTYDEAVRKCVKKTFADEVKKYQVENKVEIQARNVESFKPFSDYTHLGTENAENYVLMEKMLFEAFQYLRKNPKFVWAQLPDAHKIPSLREWMARRLGKVYTPEARSKSYRMSCIIFGALDKSEFKFTFPTAKHIGKNYFLNYNCRNHIARKVQHVKDKFYHHLDSHFLDHTRIFWFAMRGYICSNGPPRKTFYSYMPSRQQDIQHFRLWKSSEYRNNWDAWNSRCFKKSQQH